MINRYISQFEMDELLRQGVEHFNKRLFYEAHEFWEEIWHTRNGSEKAFFQGLILLAGAGVHYQKQRNEPAQRLLKLAQIRFNESQDIIPNYFDPQLIREVHRHLTNVGINGIPELVIINKTD